MLCRNYAKACGQVQVDVDQNPELFRRRMRHDLNDSVVDENAQRQKIPANLSRGSGLLSLASSDCKTLQTGWLFLRVSARTASRSGASQFSGSRRGSARCGFDFPSGYSGFLITVIFRAAPRIARSCTVPAAAWAIPLVQTMPMACSTKKVIVWLIFCRLKGGPVRGQKTDLFFPEVHDMSLRVIFLPFLGCFSGNSCPVSLMT